MATASPTPAAAGVGAVPPGSAAGPAPGAAAPGLPPGLPLPPGFPPGVDPTTYKIAEVTTLLEAAAYFPLATSGAAASAPAAGATSWRLDVPLDRLILGGEPPAGGRGVRATNEVDGRQARLGATVRPMPESFVAAPHRPPPPTPYSAGAAQRLAFSELEIAFGLGDHGVSGFGTGRTFPAAPGGGGGGPRFAAVVEVERGWGRFAGLSGAVVLDGRLGPDGLELRLMLRMMDPEGRLTTDRGLPGGRSRGDGGATTTLALLGEVDPSRPVELIAGPGGLPVGSRVFEKLRLVELDADLNEVRPRARRVAEAVVGEVEAILIFDPLSQASVVPIQTRRGIFRLYDEAGGVAGCVCADMVEGRGFPTRLAGAPLPVFRFAGFGPLLGGSGRFEGARGMMTMDSAISVFPRTLSNLYLLRFDDPGHRLRAPRRSLGRRLKEA